jgi:hypothetical protein
MLNKHAKANNLFMFYFLIYKVIFKFEKIKHSINMLSKLFNKLYNNDNYVKININQVVNKYSSDIIYTMVV